MKTILIGLIKLYQLILSPWVGQQCRFTPSCSNYSIEAIQKYGAIKGCWLTFKRLIRCHPFCDGGKDPVP
ncbi:membrane protein insertion efficiency factor YidD [Wohlfahrtiimonas chitiniclastica]|uniref:Putative membrane protein insertion efficiency factor n=2 Tax=Wohlfahrtiimonas chitiniclastica TaxID=400946 RepID=L8XU40_9GAMM|nr:MULTISPECIES: membrane protein insertion efficiency factor YidD [Wohlfahrtiimonas]ELV07513.1 Putative membrane protein insertion efficiency factor [Wohlfahrtiimonas chitiniclastica SH04]KZS22929.1 membrane protein insertion efficiency factor YidD [Wohlfahrtiimonas chitiniclastica]KZX37134.1 membrane protein insertion efficiency factor YidD [Wohlfahrtiimonas chitiniclastica]MBS7815259.1 membrane protein insertion efficiency factor YidD [Wohlfahrtiimonas chitiniclastica]MBS7817309.1 membrane 